MSTDFIYDSCPEIFIEKEYHPNYGYHTGRWYWSVIDAKAQADWINGIASSAVEAGKRARTELARIAIEEYGMDPLE